MRLRACDTDVIWRMDMDVDMDMGVAVDRDIDMGMDSDVEPASVEKLFQQMLQGAKSLKSELSLLW